jgi:hypothetical protein
MDDDDPKVRFAVASCCHGGAPLVANHMCVLCRARLSRGGGGAFGCSTYGVFAAKTKRVVLR